MALSLRARLTATALAASLVAATVLVVGLQLLLARQSKAESVELLRGRLDAAASTIRFTPRGFRVLETPSRFLDQEIWVYDPGGRRVDGAPPPVVVRPAVRRLAASLHGGSTVVAGRFRVAARPVHRRGSRAPGAVVVGAVDLTPWEAGERRSLWLSAALGALSVFAAGAAAWIAAGSSLRHVRRMARRADDWREHDLSGRFALGPPRDELTELAHTLDRMLDRIGQALLAERRLTDEVAHELRTPLSVIRAEAELALLHVGDESGTREALRSVVAATDRMTASISTMLAAARSRHAGEASCDVGAALAGIVEDLGTVGVPVELVPVDPDLRVAAPAPVMAAALSPLLDNAVRHARTVVRLRVDQSEDRVCVVVQDDGDGVPEATREHIFEPGHTSRAEGTGLGLPLARRLARSVGGDISVGAGAGGVFVLSLPRE